MENSIREFINELFVDGPKSRKALELKEEMIANAVDKFRDLLKEGYREEDAFDVVINSIGNVQELFFELEREEQEEMEGNWYIEYMFMLQKKKAKFIAIAVGLYIFAAGVFCLFAMADDEMGLVLTAFLCIAPTVMLVYSGMMIPKLPGGEQTAVKEEYQEKKEKKNIGKEVRNAVSTIIWCATVAFYFLISFETGAWHITWVIFLVAVCIQTIVGLIFSMRR